MDLSTLPTDLKIIVQDYEKQMTVHQLHQILMKELARFEIIRSSDSIALFWAQPFNYATCTLCGEQVPIVSRCVLCEVRLSREVELSLIT